MKYKKGFKIKPYEIQLNGSLRFTDGTNNNLLANQITCEAYGYRYDTATGTCKAYDIQFRLKNLENENFTQLIGTKHTLNKGTLDTLVSGMKNETLGNNENCFITGEENTIDRDIKNATVLGKMGKASREGEVVIAGGGDEAGFLQHSEIQISGKTSDATVTTLYVQGDEDGATGSVFPPSNSICIYEMFLTVICTGGSDGTAGHYKTEKHLGSILKENDNTQTLVSSSITAISSAGDTGTAAIDVSAGDTGMVVAVTGAANRNLEWSATVHLYINKTATTI
tara:strand:- start:1411 stop:2256 length:846 start_codon:yes stop_codon:yes gene_type:complete